MTEDQIMVATNTGTLAHDLFSAVSNLLNLDWKLMIGVEDPDP
jgi:hypothetical protein